MKKSKVFSIFILCICLAAVTYLYFKEKQKSLALRLQLKVLSENKKRAVPWSDIIKKENNPTPEDDDADNIDRNEIHSAANDSAPRKDNVSTRPTEDLAAFLEDSLKNIKTQNVEDLDYALQASNELIRREPNSYSAYKAKLIILLTGEAAHQKDVDENELELLLEEMASFDVESSYSLRKEAFLIAQSTSKIEELEDDVDAIDDDLAAIDDELESISESDTDDAIQLETEKALLLDKRDKYEDDIEDISAELEDGFQPGSIPNSDVVQIPLQRWLSKGNYSEVIDESNTLVENFPDSPVGYFYLIRSLELSGRQDEALDVISESDLQEDTLNDLNLWLRRARSFDPQDYWKQLRF